MHITVHRLQRGFLIYTPLSLLSSLFCVSFYTVPKKSKMPKIMISAHKPHFCKTNDILMSYTCTCVVLISNMVICLK